MNSSNLFQNEDKIKTKITKKILGYSISMNSQNFVKEFLDSSLHILLHSSFHECNCRNRFLEIQAFGGNSRHLVEILGIQEILRK